jgi:hypothetical protein
VFIAHNVELNLNFETGPREVYESHGKTQTKQEYSVTDFGKVTDDGVSWNWAEIKNAISTARRLVRDSKECGPTTEES